MAVARELLVVIPTGPSPIMPGAGAVATVLAGGRVRVDAEGNRYQAVNLRAWADRVDAAAGRHLAGYPTVARWLLTPDDITVVGTFAPDQGRIVLDPDALDAVTAWAGEAVSTVCHTSRAAAGDIRLASVLRRHLR